MRKRRTKYIWLPTLGAEPNQGIDSSESNGFSFSCTADNVAVGACSTIALFPILEDTPQEQVTTSDPGVNIADFIGTDYVIKRIVGKCFVCLQSPAADQWPNVAVTCGFFVARADDQTQLLPAGGTTNPLAQANFDPNYVDNIREPWIWRRTWVLSNPNSTNAAGGGTELLFANFPRTNAGYGSIQDGPHIDAKTGRRVSQDERLWFAAAARGMSFTGQDFAAPGNPATDSTVTGYLDVRVLGALRKARGKSSF